jgi:hypothetical protein
MIPYLSFSDYFLLFDVPLNPIEDCPFAIVAEGSMLPAVARLVQPVGEGRLDTGFWTIECSHQSI